MRYDSEADLERGLMSIDHVVKSTLRKRATHGREKESMDLPDVPHWLQGVPLGEVFKILKMLKFAWDMRDPLKVKMMAGAHQWLTSRGYRSHPRLKEAWDKWQAASPEQRKKAEEIREQQRQQQAQQRAQQNRTERKRRDQRKRQKVARRKQRDREDELTLAAFA